MSIIESYPEGIYRIEDGKLIFGKSRSIFINNFDFHLTELKIYADGKIDCWGLVDFEEFKEKIKNGWVQTAISEGSRVSIYSLGRFNIKDSQMFVKESELIKEVKDIINELNDIPTSMELCRIAFDKYQENPSIEAKAELKKAYEDMPEHLSHYVLGDMNQKDYPIREIIYDESYKDFFINKM